ncbi:MAG TPA: hypothetical protein PLP14_08980, partial [Chitinophagaceae bacterium]|nr:hypothetical protein [Chitinophagaceae bacterium]
KSDDDHPYIYKTTNFGQSWQLIVKGIPAHHFTRCIRSDQVKKGWLYCGTEHGMYLSTNDGKNWKSLQMNLPEVPVTDLCIKEDDLVVATQGRSFWILDDLSLLRQWADESNGSSTHSMGKLTVFNPSACYRMDGYQRNAPQNEGQNPVYGVRLDFDVADWSDSSKASISFYTTGDSLLRSFSTQSEKEDALKVSRGMNMFNWNLNVKGVERIDDMILWNSNIGGYKIPPGNYKAKIKVGSDSVWQDFKVLADPNYKISSDDYQNQFRMLTVIRNKFEEVQHCILDIRQIRSQVNGLKERYGTEYPTDLDSIGKTMLKSMSKVEESLYQTKAKSGQDLLNYPIRLNDKLSGIFDAANQETAPSQQVMEAYTELNLKIEKELNEFRSLTTGLLKTFNQKAREAGLDLITVKKRS